MPMLEINWSKLIPLNVENIEKLPMEGGVYRFSKFDDADGMYYVIYVGSTESLKTHLTGYLSDGINPPLKDYIDRGGEFVFRYALVGGADERKAVERQLYKHYVPRFNMSEPQSPLDVEANLN